MVELVQIGLFALAVVFMLALRWKFGGTTEDGPSHSENNPFVGDDDDEQRGF
ncbi:hypothetical protein [Haloarchaeobius amylolyticus]|uniref:hypothetical protein n=1 Tax=Haloarchaeobius amylolyticus TaxID=1198296 RepID=UPI00226EA15F|nr:hypothetical protein [Haloarchaeobius amylolyticus]